MRALDGLDTDAHRPRADGVVMVHWFLAVAAAGVPTYDRFVRVPA